MALNRDARRVPDRQLVGQGYLLQTKLLLEEGKVEEAGKVAAEGHQRRVCRSTLLALASWYGAQRSPVRARFEQLAAACEDQS
jgi:hypothetical protein